MFACGAINRGSLFPCIYGHPAPRAALHNDFTPLIPFTCSSLCVGFELVAMESEMKGKALLMFFLFVGLVSHEVVTPVKCRRSLEQFADQKNYYSPDPHTPSHPGSKSSSFPLL